MKFLAFLISLPIAVAIAVGGCGEVRPLPPAFEPQGYKPITYQELLDPGKYGLQDGQQVKVDAYFWEYLTYDPAMVRNYLALARHPVSWHRLEWFANYGSEDMKGYYDLAAIDSSQIHLYKLNRLDHVTLYGEFSSLGCGQYLHVHHIEQIKEE